MAKITISEALNWKKTLSQRHAELVELRNENSSRRTRYIGANAEKNEVREALYDPKELDRMISRVAREIRILDNAIKLTNATTKVKQYEQNDEVLGELK